MAMDLHDCRIDHGVFQVRFTIERIEYPFENIGFYPSTEPLERAVPVPEVRRQVAPR